MSNGYKFFNIPAAAFFLFIFFIFYFQDAGAGFHEHLSTHAMAIAENMEFKNPALMYHSKYAGADGKTEYGVYNRFPPLAFLLIKFFSGFSASLAGKIYVSRSVMLFFFAASVYSSFLIADFILESKVKSLLAVALAYSTFYISYYNDMIFNDIPQLFCFILLLYLIMKKSGIKKISCAVFLAVLIGWQFISAVFAWFLIEAALFFNDKSRRSFISTKKFLSDNHSAAVLVISLALCAVTLAALLACESAATGRGFWASGSFKSMVYRLGMAPAYNYGPGSAKTGIDFYAEQQLFRFMMGFYPFYAVRLAEPFKFVLAPLKDFGIDNPDISHYAVLADIYAGLMNYREHASAPAAGFQAFIGALTLINLIVAALFFYSLYLNRKNEKVIYSSALMILAPVAWFVIFRRFAVAHDFQTIFFITAALAVHINLAGLLNGRIASILAAAACLLFFDNYIYFSRSKVLISLNSARLTAAFDAAGIETEKNKKVYIDFSGYFHHDIDYYTAGTIRSDINNAEVIITDKSDAGYKDKFPDKKLVVIDTTR